MASGLKVKIFFGVFALCFIFAQQVYPSGDIVPEISRVQKNIRTIQAGFIQEKHSELLERPIISRGVFYFSSPDSFIWDYSKDMKIISDGKELVIYYKELKEADIVDVTKFSALPGSFSIERLKERYRIEAGRAKNSGYVLKLSPLIKSMPFKEMRIILDSQGAPSEVEMIERTGDSTVIKFKDVRVNIPIPEGFFSMKLPEGVKIRRH